MKAAVYVIAGCLVCLVALVAWEAHADSKWKAEIEEAADHADRWLDEVLRWEDTSKVIWGLVPTGSEVRERMENKDNPYSFFR